MVAIRDQLPSPAVPIAKQKLDNSYASLNNLSTFTRFDYQSSLAFRPD